MTVWDIVDKIIGSLPPLMMALILPAVAIIFVVGFSKHGVSFLKYGFKQMVLDSSLERLTANLATKDDFNRLDAKIEAIEVNHFGHLKNYLGILNGVLLDKQIIDNEVKARLDNELRGM